jgi:uncharacterized protein YijF (DUF1287 family)
MSTGSRFRALAIFAMMSPACAAQPTPSAPLHVAAPTPPPAPAIPPERALGVADHGIWSDLDDRVQIDLPADLAPDRVSATVDDTHHLLVLSIDDHPRKVYPLGGPARLDVGAFHLALRAGDRAELAPLLRADRVVAAVAPRSLDRDDDGIPDPLDVFIGAKKTALNGDAYTEGYFDMPYPGGDMPRDKGVCTDVVIRAARNAGTDIQRELHEDIARARAAYPMVRGLGDPSIDQRRVGTLLPFFLRHWQRHTTQLDDPRDPLEPGDVVFLDTFPDRPGPDHLGVVSDRIGDSGHPVVINNWTDGMVTKEMDILGFVPVLYRFRLAPTGR